MMACASTFVILENDCLFVYPNFFSMASLLCMRKKLHSRIYAMKEEITTVLHGKVPGSSHFFRDARLNRGRFARVAKTMLIILEAKMRKQ